MTKENWANSVSKSERTDTIRRNDNTTCTNKAQALLNFNDQLFQALTVKKLSQRIKYVKNVVIVITPVPKDAPKLSHSEIYKKYCVAFGGHANHYYPYRNEQGELLGYILRWDSVKQVDGSFKKEIRPFVYGTAINGEKKWSSQGFPEPRPLFNLDKIAQNITSTILIVEGEKTALAAEKLFPTYVVTTTMQGAQSASLTDYSSLKGRHIICMDEDDTGYNYCRTVRDLLLKSGVVPVKFLNNDIFRFYKIVNGQLKLLKNPRKLKSGYDLADAVLEGWQQDHFEYLDNKGESAGLKAFVDEPGLSPPQKYIHFGDGDMLETLFQANRGETC